MYIKKSTKNVDRNAPPSISVYGWKLDCNKMILSVVKQIFIFIRKQGQFCPKLRKNNIILFFFFKLVIELDFYIIGLVLFSVRLANFLWNGFKPAYDDEWDIIGKKKLKGVLINFEDWKWFSNSNTCKTPIKYKTAAF